MHWSARSKGVSSAWPQSEQADHDRYTASLAGKGSTTDQMQERKCWQVRPGDLPASIRAIMSGAEFLLILSTYPAVTVNSSGPERRESFSGPPLLKLSSTGSFEDQSRY